MHVFDLLNAPQQNEDQAASKDAPAHSINQESVQLSVNQVKIIAGYLSK